MSARAASRLETLGFRQVYRYQAGKADWFAAGLAREGAEAGTPRVADIAERDVPTFGIDDTVGAVRDRLRDGGSDAGVVVDDRRVVLGVVEDVSPDTAPDTRVEHVMQSSPITFRPDVRAGHLPDYLKAPRTPLAVVTTSDGVLVGLLRIVNRQTGDRPAPERQ